MTSERVGAPGFMSYGRMRRRTVHRVGGEMTCHVLTERTVSARPDDPGAATVLAPLPRAWPARVGRTDSSSGRRTVARPQSRCGGHLAASTRGCDDVSRGSPPGASHESTQPRRGVTLVVRVSGRQCRATAGARVDRLAEVTVGHERDLVFLGVRVRRHARGVVELHRAQAKSSATEGTRFRLAAVSVNAMRAMRGR